MRKTIDKHELRATLYTLDWIKILDMAIKMRRTSWGEDPVREWRNAGDTVCFALMHALEEIGVFPTREEEINEFLKKHTKDNQT